MTYSIHMTGKEFVLMRDKTQIALLEIGPDKTLEEARQMVADLNSIGAVRQMLADEQAKNAALREESDRLNAECNQRAERIAEATRGLEWQPAYKKLQAENTALLADKERKDAELLSWAASSNRYQAERNALRAYVFEMESALRGARASGTASQAALAQAECAELRYTLHQARAELAALRAEAERHAQESDKWANLYDDARKDADALRARKEAKP